MKKLIQKGFATALALVMCLSLLPMTAFAATQHYCVHCVKTTSFQLVPKTEPTCQREGEKEHYECTVCGTKYHHDMNTIYTSWELLLKIKKVPCEYSVPATCTSPATCRWCGAEDPKGEVDTNNHSWGAWQDNHDGTHSRVCSRSEAHVIGPQDHSYENGVCKCGATEPVIVPEPKACEVCGLTDGHQCPDCEQPTDETHTCGNPDCDRYPDPEPKPEACKVCGLTDGHKCTACGESTDETHTCGNPDCDRYPDPEPKPEACEVCGLTDGHQCPDCEQPTDDTHTCGNPDCDRYPDPEPKPEACKVCGLTDGHQCPDCEQPTDETHTCGNPDCDRYPDPEPKPEACEVCGLTDGHQCPDCEQPTDDTHTCENPECELNKDKDNETKPEEKPEGCTCEGDKHDPENPDCELNKGEGGDEPSDGGDDNENQGGQDSDDAASNPQPGDGTENPTVPDDAGDEPSDDGNGDENQGGDAPQNPQPDAGIQNPIVPGSGVGVTDTPSVPAASETEEEVEIDETVIPLASGPVTRAEFIDYLWRHEGEPESEPATFADVPADHEHAQAIGWAEANGIALGIGNDEFAPDDLVTVEQVRLFLIRFADWKGLNVDVYALVSLTGGDNEAVLNCDEILEEFFSKEQSE